MGPGIIEARLYPAIDDLRIGRNGQGQSGGQHHPAQACSGIFFHEWGEKKHGYFVKNAFKLPDKFKFDSAKRSESKFTSRNSKISQVNAYSRKVLILEVSWRCLLSELATTFVLKWYFPLPI